MHLDGNFAAYEPAVTVLDLGSSVIPKIELPAEDRNRTSPFPYGGHRFEFRAVGSSQAISHYTNISSLIC